MNISICTYKDISKSRDKLNVLVLENQLQSVKSTMNESKKINHKLNMQLSYQLTEKEALEAEKLVIRLR